MLWITLRFLHIHLENTFHLDVDKTRTTQKLDSLDKFPTGEQEKEKQEVTVLLTLQVNNTRSYGITSKELWE